MYLGRYRVGEWVPLTVQCHDNQGTPAVPTACPTCYVWSSTTKLQTLLVPIIERFRTTGLFHDLLRLGNEFLAGHYRLVFAYAVTGTNAINEQVVQTFDVIPGGNADGPILSMHAFDRPDSLYVVQHLASGRIKRGRNPVV